MRRDGHQPPFQGIQIFATLRNNFDEPLVYQILREMSQVGVDIITSNAEYGPGQMEINFAPALGSPPQTRPSPSKTGSRRSPSAAATWPPS